MKYSYSSFNYKANTTTYRIFFDGAFFCMVEKESVAEKMCKIFNERNVLSVQCFQTKLNDDEKIEFVSSLLIKFELVEFPTRVATIHNLLKKPKVPMGWECIIA